MKKESRPVSEPLENWRPQDHRTYVSQEYFDAMVTSAMIEGRRRNALRIIQKTEASLRKLNSKNIDTWTQ